MTASATCKKIMYGLFADVYSDTSEATLWSLDLLYILNFIMKV